jgi:iron complex outermembrane recepter protein
MGAISRSISGALNGSDRDFVNTNQPSRGLSADTRGTPIATAFPIGANAIFAPTGSLLSGVTLLEAGATVPANGGINFLDLPGGAGCGSVDGGFAYDEQLWNAPANRFACAWDTGRAAVLQQPLNTLTYFARGTVALGDHRLSAEVTGSDARSTKRFSNNQYSGNAGTLPLYYPRNALTAATYDDVYNRLVAVFPQIAVNRGKPIAYRWRNIAGGGREYITDTKTLRASLSAEGPLFAGWDYAAGASYARSESSSVLGNGYHYRGTFAFGGTAAQIAAALAATGVPGAVNGGLDPRAPTAPGATAPGIVGLLNSGILNPFSVTQSAAALAGLNAISAKGTTLYGGKYEVKQFDASISGSLFDLPGGTVKVAIGADYRRETYSFNGSPAAALGQPDIFNVAFDNINALTTKSRDVKAAYAEVSIPVFEPLEIVLAGRVDSYSGFGTTWNPKVSAKFQPIDWLLFRASYNTGFRVPAFNQIFNGITVSPNPGSTLVDTTTCPVGGVTNVTPGCASINPESLSGGNPLLRPEESEQYSVGVVFQPSARFSASVDFWSIAVDDVIGAFTLSELLQRQNSPFATQQLIRNAAGTIVVADLRATNTGSRRTSGIEVALRGGVEAMGGIISAGLDGTYLVKKRVKLFQPAPYYSELGVFSFAGDLGLKWKHNAFVTFSNDDFTLSFSQIYRDGYVNQVLPGSLSRPDFNVRVKPLITYNASIAVDVAKQLRLTAGVKNVFNTDPPFAISYDSNTGAGSSWEPRVADPRGRSFTMSVEAKF